VTLVRILLVIFALLTLTRALPRASLARAHRQVGDFVGWCVVAVVAVAVVVVAVAVMG
jgi:hypothetical protein